MLELAVVTAVLIGGPLAIAWLTGSLRIPHNDAWSHSKIAQTFARTGEIQLLGWNRSSLVGQIVILGPLGSSVAAQQLFVAFCGAVALILTYFLVRPRAGHRYALLSAITLGVVPEYGLLSTSYMTDIPALAGMLLSLWTGDLAVRRGGTRWLVLSLGAGLWGVTIREQSIAIPVAVIVCVWSRYRSGRVRTLALSIVFAVLMVAFELWRRSLPGDDPPGFAGIHLRPIVVVAFGSIFMLGLYLLPVTASLSRFRRWRRISWLAGSILLLTGVGLVLFRHVYLMRLGNYLGRTVAYGAASTNPPTVIPIAVWAPVILGLVVGGALLAGITCSGRLRREPLLWLAGSLVIMGTLAQAAVGQDIFSRYLLILIPIGAAIFGHSIGVPRFGVGLAIAAILASFSLVLTAATYSYDSARWAAAEQLVSRGVPATDIDAGLEWVGTHASGRYHANLPAREDADAWYVRAFEGSRACYIIAGEPIVRRTAVETFKYTALGWFGSAELYVYRNPCA